MHASNLSFFKRFLVIIAFIQALSFSSFADTTLTASTFNLFSSETDYSIGSITFQAIGDGSNDLSGTGTLSTQSTFYFTGDNATLSSSREIGNLVVGNGTNSSTLTITNLAVGGTVTISSASTLNIGQQLTLSGGSSLSGTGMLFFDSSSSGIVFSSGSTGGLSPGTSNGIGTLLINNTSANASLTLQSSTLSYFDIGSSSNYDQVNLGTTSIDYSGTLTLNFMDGYTPADGETYQLFTNSGDATGSFASITSNLDGYEYLFDETTGILTLEAIPEPSCIWLLGLGSIFWVFGQRAFAKKSRLLPSL